MTETYQRIYQVVDRIPHGRVATYGQIAKLAGIPGHARQVGYALSSLSDEKRIAWHRVINSRGQISARSEPNAERHQRALLEHEGIVFDEQSRISLQRFLWQPAIHLANRNPSERKRSSPREKAGRRILRSRTKDS